jgi:hypothetical protein
MTSFRGCVGTSRSAAARAAHATRKAHAGCIDLAFPSRAGYARTEGFPAALRSGNGPWGENTVRRLLLVLGLLALAMGLLWVGQGTGAIAWPQSSFMINQLQWAGYGAALSALGLVLIWQARR